MVSSSNDQTPEQIKLPSVCALLDRCSPRMPAAHTWEQRSMKYIPIKVRFCAMLAKLGDLTQDACWPWPGARDTAGYGMIRGERNQGNVATHRLSYELARGTIPDGMSVLHKCDNPPCCNPNHLFLGDYQDNRIDCVNKGRAVTFPKGSRHPMAKLTEDTVREARRRLAAGETGKAIAADLHVSQTAISDLNQGRTWSHVV